jgi:Icc protein
MADRKQNLIDRKFEDLNHDGVDRRGFLKCMAWAGTGLVWTMNGGIPASRLFARSTGSATKSADFNFVQISDSHIGFDKPANPDV